MKLTFLGTSHGVPMTTRFCTSTLLTVDGAAYLIDAGAPVADLLIRRGVPFSAIKAVFCTHMHTDHMGGLPGLLSLSNWRFKDADFDIYLSETEGIRTMRDFVACGDKAFDDARLRFHLIEAGPFYKDEHIAVTALPTRHMGLGFPSYGFCIEAEGKRIIITGDLQGPAALDFPAFAKENASDLIVTEMAHFDAATAFGHLALCPTRQVLFHHVYNNYEANMAAIRDAEGRYPFSVRAVEDGDEVTL